MSWTKFTCLLSFCALLAAPVMAQPTLSVTRNAGLASNGGFVWSVAIDPDEAMFTDPADNPDRGLGGSTAIDVGFDLSGGLSAASATANGTNVADDNPGLSTFGDETPDGDGDFVGVQVGSDASNVFASVGSQFFTDGSPKELLTITTLPLNTDNLTTSVAWGGGYDASGNAGAGNFGAVAQLNAQYGVQGAASYTALVGDVNLDGIVNITDIGILSGNWLSSGGFWGQGNLNNQTDALVNITDIGILSGNWLATAPGAAALGSAAIPEPASCVLAGVGLLAAVALRRRSA